MITIEILSIRDHNSIFSSIHCAAILLLLFFFQLPYHQQFYVCLCVCMHVRIRNTFVRIQNESNDRIHSRRIHILFLHFFHNLNCDNLDCVYIKLFTFIHPTHKQKIWFQHIIPSLVVELEGNDVPATVLQPILYIIEESTPEEYQEIILPHIRSVFSIAKSIQVRSHVLLLMYQEDKSFTSFVPNQIYFQIFSRLWVIR